MTNSFDFPVNHYPTDWLDSVCSSNHSLFIPLQDNVIFEAESLRTLFSPSAGTLYLRRPGKRRKALNKAVDKLEASCLPGFAYVISYHCCPIKI